MIIGFAGPKRSGKSYVAEALCNILNDDYYTLEKPRPDHYVCTSFADPLRAFVLDVFGMDYRHSEGYLKEVPVRSVMPTHEHVKAACKEHFGNIKPARLIGGYLTSNQEQYKFINKSYRELMIYIGTELIRKGVDDDYWVSIMDKRAKKAKHSVIITDVRMPNEAEWVRSNGKLIHIENPEVGFTGEHSTEVGVPMENGDLIFTNNPKEGPSKFEANIKLIKEELLYGKF